MTIESEAGMADHPPTTQDSEVRPRRRRWPWVLAASVAALLIYNLTVWLPAANALGQDARNEVTGLHVYRSWFVHPRDITIDLVTLGEAAPIDLTRGLFQAADALKDREFGRVILARQGRPVFMMEGPAFQELGQAYAGGENPVYLLRTLPEQLYRTDGQPAFGTWSGGWLGVLGKQMEDLNAMAAAWAIGEAPGSTAQ